MWRRLISEFVNEPFDKVKANMVRFTFFYLYLLIGYTYTIYSQEKGSFTPCIASRLIEELKEQSESGIDEDIARSITAIAYGGESRNRRKRTAY